MLNINLATRAISLLLHFLRFLYWQISEKSAKTEKPLILKPNRLDIVERVVTAGFGCFIGLQLLGINIYPFGNQPSLQIAGLCLVILGIGIAMSARRELGTNWAHAAEYQVKKNQEIIMTGIYRYIRHPIYFGMSLAYVGSELVAGSWLVLAVVPILAAITVRQAKNEEKLLLGKFGKEYKDYMNRSHRFIPFIY